MKTSKLSRRLTISIIFFSSLITLLLTGVQLYTDYHNDLKGIQRTVNDIELGIVNSISTNLWMDDKEEVYMLLKGISALPDINYAAIVIHNRIYSESGKNRSRDIVNNKIPITYTYNNELHKIATLHIQSDLNNIYSRIINRFWIILASNALKTFLVVLFIFALLNKVLINRLQHISSFIKAHNNNKLNNRINPFQYSKSGKPDEIDDIIMAINEKQQYIEDYVIQLRQSEEKNRLLLNASGEGIFGLDNNSNITFINPKGLQLLGYEEMNSLTGKSVLLITDREFLQQEFDSENQELLKGDFIKQNGEKFPVEYTKNDIISENRLSGGVVTFRDITEQETIRETLISAKEHAEASNRAKSLFLANMSHELRTPMNAILGFGQLLSMDPQLSERQKDSVKEIMDSGKHLLNLIDEVLDLARIESGKLRIDARPTQVTPLIFECISLIKPLADNNRISIINHLDISDDHTLDIDPQRFKQVIINILSNAIKYNTMNGQVIINNTINHKLNMLRITISDTGKGISPEDIEKLFTPFERFGEYSGVDGTGIGLSITKSLVEAMHGEIGVRSSKEEGTDFWIEFPIVQDNIIRLLPDISKQS